MTPVTTHDDSETLYSGCYGETYHSLNGAVREAVEKFVLPCGIGRLALAGEVRILDVGFGLGYNAMAAIRAARGANPAAKVRIVSLERDLVDAALLRPLAVPSGYEEVREEVLQAAEAGFFRSGSLEIELGVGDARSTVAALDETFDAVFHDPFSPRKNPELWTVGFFRALFNRMTESAIMATYSSATPVRCGLLAAGFKIGPGPGDAMKRGGTLASRGGTLPPLGEKEQRRLEISPERTPYRDSDQLDLSPGEILLRREAEKGKGA